MKASHFLFAFLLVLTGCGKSDNSSVAAGASSVPPPGGGVIQTSNTYAMTTGLQGSYPYVFANYQFKENGCDTDLHRFSGPAPEIVLAQMCSFLQNEGMNHNCARDLRMAYFSQICH